MTNQTSDTNPDHTETGQEKIGPVLLQKGISRHNAMALFYSGAMTIIFVTFLNLVNPYLLEEHLSLPDDIRGNFTGNLYVMAEIVSLSLTIPLGVLSDRVGRRIIFGTGFVIVSIALLLLPTATTPMEMVVWRLLVSAGIACCTTMTASLIADYADNSSRGKILAFNGIFSALGIVIVASLILSSLPDRFQSLGYDPITAGKFTYWIAAALAVIAGCVAFKGIRNIEKPHEDESLPLAETFKTGMKEIIGNPRLSLGAGATYVSRGDLTVLAAFFSLWIVAVGTGGGMDTGEAQAKAGMLFGISQLAVPLFLPVVGWLVDKLDRVTALAWAMGLAAIGYTWLGLVEDPINSPVIYFAGIITGMGEAAVIVTAPALVGQETPRKIRGSVIGTIAFFGAIGVLVNVKVAGLAYDNISYTAPFLIMGGLNALMATWAILVRWRCGHKAITKGEH